MNNLIVGLVELLTHFHDDVDDHYTLSSKTEPNKIVVISP